MKKLMTTVAFGTLLVAGFAAIQEAPADSAMEWEPRVYSVEQDISQF